MPTLRQAVKRLRDRWILPPSGNISVKELNVRFHPFPAGSLSSLLRKMGENLADHSVDSSTHPYYRRSMPSPQKEEDFASDTTYIDLTNTLPMFGELNTVDIAVARFDARAAATVKAAHASITKIGPVEVNDLLDVKSYGDKAPDVRIPTTNSLARMALMDYFPGVSDPSIRNIVSEAILAANPGWCGTWGPGVDGTLDILGNPAEGNYDMSQMHLLKIAYRYYDELWPEAQEHLINELLARGRIHRPNKDDTFTSGGAPNDWSTAGFIEIPIINDIPIIDIFIHPTINIQRIGETENHILTIHTARYLTNQLLYQRSHDPNYDNRRNGSDDARTCTELILYLLCNILRDDFSEYNAKNYQNEVRDALLNLCDYAYDHEVRLAARMVLDYVSAHIAVSSNDLRRMVPFRRRNETKNVARDDRGYMEVNLLETTRGADPMAQRFAILAGNTRIYGFSSGILGGKDGDETGTRNSWHIKTDGTDGAPALMDALSDYRLPTTIHDLFVNDLHRRFFQRLHRFPMDNEDETGRNCDNQEIYASSPSYLLSAGGSFATWAIDPGPVSLSAKLRKKNDQQLGVAVTTSFMPTTRPSLDYGDPTRAIQLIQFGHFSDVEGVYNYGVAPDFACGPQVNLPGWCQQLITAERATYPKGADGNPQDIFGRFRFVNRGSGGDGPGFFLAFFQDGDFAVMEAFDTWLHPGLKFEQFRINVYERNRGIAARGLINNKADIYTTENGNRVSFTIWDVDGFYGAKVNGVDYSGRDPMDSLGDAGNQYPLVFLNGTILNSKGDGKIEINNPLLDQKTTLDMTDQAHPRRISETGEVEEAGFNNEVWVDFGWTGPYEGDFFHPFNTIAAAAGKVADGGVIKIMPGWTTEKPSFPRNKRFRLNAPIGKVTFAII